MFDNFNYYNQLNADNDAAGMLEKAKAGGGKILTPKTKLSDQFGFIAVFLDTEGNRIALHVT
jgi:predicted enzyme related to lactoylglutathione lyase